VVDLLERYYLECEGPRYTRLRKHLIPFAERFYANLTEDAFDELKEATAYFKEHYPSKIQELV